MAKKNQSVELEPVVESPVALRAAPIVTDVAMSIIAPLVTPEQARKAWKQYEELCKAILAPEDLVKITSFNGKKSIVKYFKTKSAWRKISTAFNLSTEIIKEDRLERDGYFVVQITARTTAPNGRFVDGTGACASNERKFTHLEHDVRAQAETRAKNRSIADLIGGGEVSAEEVMEMEEQQKEKCPRDHTQLPQKTVSTEGKNKGRPYLKCPACAHFEWLDEEKKEEVINEDKV